MSNKRTDEFDAVAQWFANRYHSMLLTCEVYEDGSVIPSFRSPSDRLLSISHDMVAIGRMEAALHNIVDRKIELLRTSLGDVVAAEAMSIYLRAKDAPSDPESYRGVVRPMPGGGG